MDTDIRQFLTSSDLFLTACRAAFIGTFDRMLSQFLVAGQSVSVESGYLDNVPLLKGCALQIQLELLLQTWGGTAAETDQVPGIEEQCVCFAALEELNRLVCSGNRRLLDRAMQRRQGTASDDFLWMPSKVRAIQVTLPFAAQAAVLSPETGLASEELEAIRVAGGLNRDDLETLLALTGRWRMNSDVLKFCPTLLTEHEQNVLLAFLDEFPDLLLPEGASE
ncbi:MAG: hypothetical protein KDA85_10170 [Planctomycetaceae bacterium]|nr:hypothetical protein [Planctomycetaceae bacterium]